MFASDFGLQIRSSSVLTKLGRDKWACVEYLSFEILSAFAPRYPEIYPEQLSKAGVPVADYLEGNNAR